jgi:predicted YcjX-like family ATPase
MFSPRIDRIVFAATKADHLHRTSHDRLEAILKRMVQHAATRAEIAGAGIDAIALAAVRATREARVQRGGEDLPSIVGTPLTGEVANGQTFDGKTEVATFPGDLPADPESLFASGGGFRGLTATTPEEADFRFLRFRPPAMKADEPMPHIRLDRALEVLLGDRLQ